MATPQPQTFGSYDPYNMNSGTKIDTNQMPMFPSYQSMLDSQGNIKNQYQYKPVDTSAYKREALNKQGQEQVGLQNTAAQGAASAGAQANARLAQRGGLGGGARERGAYSSAYNSALAQQGVAQQGAQARAGINLETELMNQDQQNKAQTANLGLAERQFGGGNQYAQGLYSEAMKGYAAKQAAGTTAGGKYLDEMEQRLAAAGIKPLGQEKQKENPV